MASLDFPSNPTNGQTYALNGVTYYYNSTMGAWLTQLTSMNLSTSSNTQVLFNDAGLANGSSGLVYNKVAGNLGIGTTALGTERLSINSASSALMMTLNSTAANGGYITGYSSGTAVWYLGTAKQAFNTGTSSDAGISTNSGFLGFGTNTTERMRIDTNGAVLIGNTVSAQVGSNYPTITRNSASAQLLLQRGNDSAGWGAIGADDTFAFNVYNQSFGAKVFAVTQTNGKVVLKGGNATDSGTGISFPGTQSASSDANTLDDYEEGTFNPTLTSNLTAPTGISYTYQRGAYVKIGRMVYVSITIGATWTNSPTGQVQITLPFTVNDPATAYSCAYFGYYSSQFSLGAGRTQLMGEFYSGGGALAQLVAAGSGVAPSYVTYSGGAATVSSGFFIEMSGTYQTAN